MYYIGEATSDWKQGNLEYERIKGILVDVKYLMHLSEQHNRSQISTLADIIAKS